tara:strand:+ start:526 stop:2385 length:1860 start_codon:yes stop_codon:yes gene_type:complete
MFAGLLALAIVYWPGIHGMFFIDDALNFEGVLQVIDIPSAIYYVFTGHAGPLGRPVALASFLLHGDAYPNNPLPFIGANIAIHLGNVALLAWAMRRLQIQAPAVLGTSVWLAPIASLLWGALPILASTSLMAVQRMTSLSALFMLLGVHCYLYARVKAHERNCWGLFASIIGIGVCTLLAMFTKENGALLPLLLLAMHGLLFTKEKSVIDAGAKPKFCRYALTAALCLPSLLLLAYIVSCIPSVEARYWNRPFTLSERLASQVVILWEYLRVAFLPRFADMSPFADDYPIRHFSDRIVQLSLLAWGAVFAASILLWRRRKPLALFALLWYLFGHLIESSLFPLYLYFEHRNYIPIIGPVLLLVVSVLKAPVSANLKITASIIYTGFLIFVLWQTSSTWGSRQLIVWAKDHPDSPRALQLMAGAYMNAGRVDEVLALYGGALERNPKLTSVSVQGLRASCYVKTEREATTQAWLESVRQTLPFGDFSLLTISSLEAVMRLQLQGHCAGLQSTDVLELVDLIKSNPVYRRGTDPNRLSAIRANIYLARGDTEAAMMEMRKGLEKKPDLETIQVLYRLLLANKGDVAGREFLQWARTLKPRTKNSLIMKRWQRDLAALESGA